MIEMAERPATQAAPQVSPQEIARAEAFLRSLVERRAAPQPEPEPIFVPAPAWAPRTSARIQLVESVVVVGIMVYFASPALRFVGWL